MSFTYKWLFIGYTNSGKDEECFRITYSDDKSHQHRDGRCELLPLFSVQWMI